MNHHTINPVGQNNRSTPRAASAEDNQPQPTEACEQVSSVSEENRIKLQSCLALELAEAAYKLGYLYLQQYEIFQKHIDSEQPETPETILTLMNAAKAMPIQILKDKAYQAIALKQPLDLYFRLLALDNISCPMKRLQVGLKALKISPKHFTLEGYYKILQGLLPENWTTIAPSPEITIYPQSPTLICIPSCTEKSYDAILQDLRAKERDENQKTILRSAEIDPANPLSLNPLGTEALRNLELDPYTNQIELLSEEELEGVLKQLDNCYHNLSHNYIYSEAVSVFLDIAKGPYAHIDSVSSQVLSLLDNVQKDSRWVHEDILAQVPRIYSTLIKEGSFLPTIRLKILKTMAACQERTELAEYLLLDPSSPVVLELKIFESSTNETPIAVRYLECIELLQDDSKIDHLLETIYKLPVFNHIQQFYSLLLKLEHRETPKHLIQRTQNKETDPNCPESDAMLEAKHKALVSAQGWVDLGIQDFTNHGFRRPSL